MMESQKLDVSSDAHGTWGGLKLVPSTVWIALVVVLGTIAAVAAIGEGMGRFIAMTVVSLVLLAVIVRLFAGEAARQRALRVAAEQQTAEFERLIAIRTRELSELSTHLQQFAEKEKSELARHLHDELGGLLTAAKMDLSWLQARVTEAPYQRAARPTGRGAGRRHESASGASSRTCGPRCSITSACPQRCGRMLSTFAPRPASSAT